MNSSSKPFALVLNEGKSVTAVARELDLVPSALGQWVKQAQDTSFRAEYLLLET